MHHNHTRLRREAGPAAALPGFLRGTRIMTERGELAVEQLQPGMHVLTGAGKRRRIAWIGQRRIEPRRHPHPDWVAPLRVRRGAIENGMPRHDLHVSPGLLLVIAEAALPAHALVNGATIAPAALEAADYFHIALDHPDTLVAEGVGIASHDDPSGRAVFGNGGAVLLLHPGPPGPPQYPGSLLQQARRHLLRRAHALGHVMSRDAGLQLRADGWPIKPSVVAGPLHRFVLPAGVSDLRIVSRAGVPAELDPGSSDRRRLGVMVERIALRGPHAEATLTADNPALSEGFHPAESDGARCWRWTDGHARLPAPLVAGMSRLDLFVTGFQPAWAGTPPPNAPATRSA